MELIADQRRPPRGYRVVVGHRVNRRNHMVVDKVPRHVHRPVGKAVRAGVDGPIRAQEAALVNLRSVRVGHHELGPGLVKVPHFRNERVPDVLVLDHHPGFNLVLWLHCESPRPQRGNQSTFIADLQREDIHVEKVPGLEEIGSFRQLLVEPVVERHRGIPRLPTVRDERPILRSRLGQSGRGALHVAILAGGKFGGIEGERIALGKLRILPLVVGGKRANPLVFVQQRRQVGFVAGRAELRLVVNILHHSFRVPVEMRQNLRVRHHPRNPLAAFIHHHRRHAHHKAAIAVLRRHALNRVAGHAGQSVAIEHPVDGRFRVQPSAQHGHRIVAAIAVARKLNAFGPQQNIHARPVKRRSEGVRVQRLPPLMIGLLVAVSAILGVGKCVRIEKIAAHGRGVAGQGDASLGNGKVISLPDLVRVGLAHPLRLVIGAICVFGSTGRAQKEGGRGD